jgi:hypothetical protein
LSLGLIAETATRNLLCTEPTYMNNQPASTAAKPKRLSKGQRIHKRRQKQSARKAGTTSSQPGTVKGA